MLFKLQIKNFKKTLKNELKNIYNLILFLHINIYFLISRFKIVTTMFWDSLLPFLVPFLQQLTLFAWKRNTQTEIYWLIYWGSNCTLNFILMRFCSNLANCFNCEFYFLNTVEVSIKRWKVENLFWIVDVIL